MSTTPSPRITPYLLYRDVDRALEFLSAAFELEAFGETLKGSDGKLQHAAMRLGDDGLDMMGCPGHDYRKPKDLGRRRTPSAARPSRSENPRSAEGGPHGAPE